MIYIPKIIAYNKNYDVLGIDMFCFLVFGLKGIGLVLIV